MAVRLRMGRKGVGRGRREQKGVLEGHKGPSW